VVLPATGRGTAGPADTRRVMSLMIASNPNRPKLRPNRKVPKSLLAEGQVDLTTSRPVVRARVRGCRVPL